MSIDATDLLRARAEAQAKAADARVAHRQTLTHVAVQLEDVLADDGWTLVGKLAGEKRAAVAAHLEALADQILGAAVGDDLVRLKLEAAEMRGLLAGIDLVLALPEQVRAQAVAEGAG